MDRAELRQQVADLVMEVTSGTVAAADLLAGGSLLDLGLDSLGWLRLIDAVELAYGVEVDLGGLDLRGATVDQLVDHLYPASG